MKARIGVVILDLDQPALTERCLGSIAAGNLMPDVVVLVEQKPNPIKEPYSWGLGKPPLVTLAPGQNTGCAGGRNLGLNFLHQNTHVDIFVIIDNDTIIPSGFFEYIASHPPHEMEILAPVILDFQTQQIWSSGGVIHSDGQIEQLDSYLSQLDRETLVWAPGACLVFDRHTWLRAGSFDVWINFLFEDIEWCLRVVRSGGTVRVDPQLQLMHEPHQALNGRWSQQRVRLWARNGCLLQISYFDNGFFAKTKWVLNEIRLALRDSLLGRPSWSLARVQGLGEGLHEVIRRAIHRLAAREETIA